MEFLTMNKLTVLIVDDEPLAHDIIIDYLNELPFIQNIHQGYSAIEALGILNEHSIDLIFLDINMPKISGIELLKTLKHQPQIIVTSAYRQYALESFELDVCDYLLKPFRLERFIKAVNKAYKQLQLLTPSHSPSPDDLMPVSDKQLTDSLFIKVDKKLVQISIAEIESLEAYGNYVKVWLGEKLLLTPRTLSSFETELNNNNSPFMRVHKSYLVQKKHINTIENNQVILRSGRQHPIGKSFRSVVKTL